MNKRKAITIILLLVILAATAVSALATVSPWRDDQSVIRPGDRLYVYCAGGHQVVKERPNVTIITCETVGKSNHD
jgi:hypothetical protein